MKVLVRDGRNPGHHKELVVSMPQCPRVGEEFIFKGDPCIYAVFTVVWTPWSKKAAVQILVR